MRNDEFEAHFNRYSKLVMKIVFDETGDRQLAQEICQQVFIGLYKHKEKITADFVKAWLMKCTQNRIIDHYRKCAGETVVVFDEEAINEQGNVLAEESVEIFERKLQNQELLGRVLREVKRVNEHWFEVLMLCCIDGVSYSEAARKLQISEQVLRARICRARKFIQQKFGDEYHNT